MLDFFFRHYDPWVDHFFLYDDSSTDGTREMLERRANVTVETLVRANPDSWVLSAQHIYNSSWQRSVGTAEWVVVANIDEHLFHPDPLPYLQDCSRRGITAIPALGYQMISREWPRPESLLWRDYPEGAPWSNMSKVQIFRPDHITASNFSPGRHRASMEGNIRLPARDEMLNLHYKYLGFEYTSDRHAELGTRLRPTDRDNNWGHKYLWSSDQLRDDVEQVYRERINVLDPNLDHHTSYPHPRWWRDRRPRSAGVAPAASIKLAD